MTVENQLIPERDIWDEMEQTRLFHQPPAPPSTENQLASSTQSTSAKNSGVYGRLGEFHPLKFPAIEKGGYAKLLENYKPVECGFCDDKGYTVEDKWQLFTGAEDKEFFLFEMETRFLCYRCKLGMKVLFQWAEDSGCNLCFWGRRLEDKYFCGCDQGRKLREQLDRAIDAKRQGQLNQAIHLSGLPDRLRHQTFDNFLVGVGVKITEAEAEQLHYARALVQVAAEERQSLFITGKPGIGKSHLAAAYLNRALARGEAGVFVSMVQLMAQLRKTIRQTDGPGWDELLEKYANAELLVLDDVGQEKASEKVVEVLWYLLTERINYGLPTVVTSNYSIPELQTEQNYPPSVGSRLASFQVVSWDVDDWRTK